MAVTAFSGVGAVVMNANAAEEDYGLMDNIQDGTILHCFDWKYSDIISELDNIRKAGFTTIQGHGTGSISLPASLSGRMNLALVRNWQSFAKKHTLTA